MRNRAARVSSRQLRAPSLQPRSRLHHALPPPCESAGRGRADAGCAWLRLRRARTGFRRGAGEHVSANPRGGGRGRRRDQPDVHRQRFRLRTGSRSWQCHSGAAARRAHRAGAVGSCALRVHARRHVAGPSLAAGSRGPGGRAAPRCAGSQYPAESHARARASSARRGLRSLGFKGTASAPFTPSSRASSHALVAAMLAPQGTSP